MFERYFCPRVVARLRASPDADWLASYLEFLDRRGHARLTVQSYLRQAELFGRWLRRHRRTLTGVASADVRTFATRRPGPQMRCNSRSAANALLRHLRDRKLILPPLTRASPQIDEVVTAYDAHLRDAAGLAEATRLYCRRYAREFLRSVFAAGPIRWERLRPIQIHRFIAGYGQSGRVAAAKVGAGSLSNFLRWLEFQGRIGPELAQAVPRFPRWRLAALPPILSDDQLTAILEGFNNSTATGRRDTAMALCLIDLGLRVGEVATLTLGDVDTSAGTLQLVAGKPRRSRIVPMPIRVRRAVLRYMRRDRAATATGLLFVRHRLPVGESVTRELIRGVIRRAYARVAGCEGLTGTHILRHTAASRLLRAGADLKRIADVLGHRSIDTTAIYAKVDVAQLATVAMPWPVAKAVP
ncbi:site-specific integrase [soil metagenome]